MNELNQAALILHELIYQYQHQHGASDASTVPLIMKKIMTLVSDNFESPHQLNYDLIELAGIADVKFFSYQNLKFSGQDVLTKALIDERTAYPDSAYLKSGQFTLAGYFFYLFEGRAVIRSDAVQFPTSHGKMNDFRISLDPDQYPKYLCQKIACPGSFQIGIGEMKRIPSGALMADQAIEFESAFILDPEEMGGADKKRGNVLDFSKTAKPLQLLTQNHY